MNKTIQTHSLRVHVANGTGYNGPHRINHLPRPGCDVITFDNLSANCHGPMPITGYVRSSNPAAWKNVPLRNKIEYQSEESL